jgi:hypothetical protein
MEIGWTRWNRSFCMLMIQIQQMQKGSKVNKIVEEFNHLDKKKKKIKTATQAATEI